MFDVIKRSKGFQAEAKAMESHEGEDESGRRPQLNRQVARPNGPSYNE